MIIRWPNWNSFYNITLIVFSLFISASIVAVEWLIRRKWSKKNFVKERCPLICLILILFLPAEYMILDGLKISWAVDFFQVVMLHLFFYLAIILIQPYFRRHYNSIACSELWLLPSLAAYAMICMSDLTDICLDFPVVMLRVDGSVIFYIAWIWLVTALLVLGNAIRVHFQYRKSLLAGARPAPEEIQLQMKQIQKSLIDTGKNGEPVLPYVLLISPAAKTPVSIGMFRKTIRILLPEREYSREEINWILRHELVHTIRRDAQLKFLIVMVQSIFWFLPPVRKGLKACSDDLELSCDDLILNGADEQARKTYAGLILDSAAEAAGFSSCLSADAEGLKYRLLHILHPVKKGNGYPLLILLTFLMFLSLGRVSLACRTDDNIWLDHISSIDLNDKEIWYSSKEDASCPEEVEEVLGDLQELELYQLTGNYGFYLMEDGDGTRRTCIDITTIDDNPEKNHGIEYKRIVIYDHYIVCQYKGNTIGSYYYKENLDWSKIEERCKSIGGSEEWAK